MSRYKAILFDMDGVIADNEELHIQAFREVLAATGHSMSDDDYAEHFTGKTDKRGFEDFQRAVQQELDIDNLLQEKSITYTHLAATQSRIYPGAVECVKMLHNSGFKLALVTGSLHKEAEDVLLQAGIDGCFGAIISADHVIHSKPDPEGYLKAAKALACKPHECLVVEDAPAGVLAASSAEMKSVAVLTTHTVKELDGATYILQALTPEAFRKLLD